VSYAFAIAFRSLRWRVIEQWTAACRASTSIPDATRLLSNDRCFLMA
jgi:hypothetical protein